MLLVKVLGENCTLVGQNSKKSHSCDIWKYLKWLSFIFQFIWNFSYYILIHNIEWIIPFTLLYLIYLQVRPFVELFRVTLREVPMVVLIDKRSWLRYKDKVLTCAVHCFSTYSIDIRDTEGIVWWPAFSIFPIWCSCKRVLSLMPSLFHHATYLWDKNHQIIKGRFLLPQSPSSYIKHCISHHGTQLPDWTDFSDNFWLSL